MMAPDDRPLAGAAWLEAPASRTILRALEAGGRPARFVGGCVRDGLLRRIDAGQDLDLATPERPERVLELLARARIKAIPTGLEHGTVTAIIGAQRFEITTLRRDVRTDGRHAEVEFTDDFEADAARRDFTINAMSCDAAGRLFDYFGGRTDLAAGRVRFVGEAALRIAEDHLRILRFFRFLAHYGRPPADAEALVACAAAAPGIGHLSGERIQTEMLKLLAAPDPLPALRLMADAGVSDHVLFGPVALERLARLLELAPEADPLLRLGALLRPPPAEASGAERVAERWRLSRRDTARLLALTTERLPAPAAAPAERRRDIYRLGAGRYADLARIAAADAGGKAGAVLADALATAREWPVPALPIGGQEILEQGVPPGPEVGRVLSAVEEWWIAQDFQPDRAACLARAQDLLSGRSSPDPAPGGA